MAEFAKADFALNARQKDGLTLRDHYLSAWEQTGEEPEELRKAPPMPEGVSYLWEYFGKLHRRRGSGVNGPEPLDHSKVLAWASLMRVSLDPWEVDAILGVDDEYLAASAAIASQGA